MKPSIAAAGRLFLIYGIPFLAIGLAERSPATRVYISAVVLACVAWMFALHLLTKIWMQRDGEN